MKNRTGIIILALICLLLGIATIFVMRRSSEQRRDDTATILNLSNKWAETTLKWEDQKQVSAVLQQDLDKTKKQHDSSLSELSNTISQVTATLEKTTASLKTTETTLASAQAEIKKNEQRIAELETENETLDRKAAQLTLSITNLTGQIAATQQKLAASEGDKGLLQKELKRLMNEKADLERQFNDLAVVRAQLAKLKEDLNIARRMDWVRQGFTASSDQKGAQQLMRGLTVPASKPASPTYDLNVEVTSSGTAKVVAPTNAAAVK